MICPRCYGKDFACPDCGGVGGVNCCEGEQAQLEREMDKPIITVGDALSVECPHCNYRITRPCKAQEMCLSPSEVLFDGLCPRCTRRIHFTANWRLIIKASTAKTF